MKLLVFSLALTVAPLPAITIEQAVQEALQNNPGLLAEKLGIPVAETAANQGGGGEMRSARA